MRPPLWDNGRLTPELRVASPKSSQTRKIRKHLPVVLFGSAYWDEVINFDALVRHGTINAEDLKLFHRTDSVDDAYEFVVSQLSRYAEAERGAIL